MTWNQRIKERREALGLSQAALADRLGMGQTSLAGYELGKTGLKLDQVQQFADALGVNAAWLAFGISAPTHDVPGSDKLDRELVRRAIIAFDKLLIRKGLSRANIEPERKAEMILAGYDLALLRGGPDSLESELERIFAIAKNG